MKTRTKVCAALAAVLAVALAVIGLTWNASFVPDEATLPEKIRDFDNIGRGGAPPRILLYFCLIRSTSSDMQGK